MRIAFESYMGTAWLLSKDGTEIEVYGHPNENFEFDSILDLVEAHGGSIGKSLSNLYRNNPTEELKSQIMEIYNNEWCKVRLWGTFGEELTFRITFTKFNWYKPIVEFLLRHLWKNTKITVESTRNGNHKIYCIEI